MQISRPTGKLSALHLCCGSIWERRFNATYQRISVDFWILIHILNDGTILHPRRYHREAATVVSHTQEIQYVVMSKLCPSAELASCTLLKIINGYHCSGLMKQMTGGQTLSSLLLPFVLSRSDLTATLMPSVRVAA